MSCLVFKYVKQGFCFCGCFPWFQVQSDVSENVKAFARALDDAELEGQILNTAKGSFKLQNVSEIWDEKQFYVRGCYKEIADIMLKETPPVMSLLGSSGIGKSNFWYILSGVASKTMSSTSSQFFCTRRTESCSLRRAKSPRGWMSRVSACTSFVYHGCRH